MSNVVKTDSDQLNSVLTVTFTPEDYQPKLKSQLEKYRKNAHMKGFRKGKTPMGFIKKMHGRAILADVINESLQSEVNKYLKESEIEILGQPLPREDSPEFDFDINNLGDFVFKFDLGLAPTFEVVGLDADNTFERLTVNVSDDKIGEELESLRKRAGERQDMEGEIVPNDMITIQAEEQEDGKAKKDGWATTFNVLVDTLEEDIRTDLLTKKTGDSFKFNIYKLEKDRTEEYVKKYLLSVGENDTDTVIGEEFEGKITNIGRVMPAELDQAFFDKVFGEGNVKSEEEAKAKMEEEVAKQYTRSAESLLFKDFQEDLLAKNPLELPEAFLKRWLKFNNEEATDEMIEKDFSVFAENLKWSLIRSKAVRKFDISISEDEIVEAFKDRIRSYFGGYGDELVILNTANRLMQDQKQVDQVYQELIADRLFESIKENVTLKDKKVSIEELEEKIKVAREEAEAAQKPANEEIEEAEIVED